MQYMLTRECANTSNAKICVTKKVGKQVFSSFATYDYKLAYEYGFAHVFFLVNEEMCYVVPDDELYITRK